MNLSEIQSRLREQSIDGWLFFDHHQRDPLAYRILELNPKQHVTRRWYYFIPQDGEPRKLVHRIESHMLDSLPGTAERYSTWQEQQEALSKLLRGATRVAMQYSPRCAIPYVSLVDAGTVELVRASGAEVVSSAELVQLFEAKLDARGLESHLEAGRLVDQVRVNAFQFIAARVAAGDVREFEVAEFVRNEFRRRGLTFESGPIVAADSNSGDPHYEPNAANSAVIRHGTFVLLDMWAKLDRPDAVYYDITWTGFCSENVPDEHQRVFDIVMTARDEAIRRVQEAVSAKKRIHGFEVDDAARSVINRAGFGPQFVHRTGHSIGTDIHGNGANMDNLETHDERKIMNWSCFSVEPGIYLPEFGIRSEVNVFVDDRKAFVTGEKQDAIVLIR
jgi:Xaa-Pro aminopeptidase